MTRSGDANSGWQAAAWPLIGVIVGALITGGFQLAVQKSSSEEALRIEGVQASRELALDYTDAAADYFNDLAYVIFFPQPGHSLEVTGSEARVERLGRSASELALKSSPEVASAVLGAQSEAELYFAGVSALASDERGRLYAETFIAVYNEASRHRLGSTPTAASDELLATFLKSLESSTSAGD